MNILVSGSHGMIGQALGTRLRAEGHQVIALVRPGSPSDPAGSAHVAWDPPQASIDMEALEKAGPIDAVVHLAGAGIADKRWTPQRRDAILDSRVASTRLLAESLPRLRPAPAVLVSGSAIGYYGDRGAEMLGEDAGPGAGYLASVCQAWESAASPVTDAGIRLVLLRTGVVLSADGGALKRQLPLFRAGVGGRLGSGTQYLSWIALDDEVGAIVHAIGTPDLAGPLNATAPAPVTNAEFTSELARALHRPALLPVPRRALGLALGQELVDEALLASQRVLPARLLASGYAFAYPELSGCLAELVGSGH